MKIPFVVTIDTEEEWDWSSGYPTRAPSVSNIAQLPRFRDLCTRHGVAATYLVNHAVMADPRARDTMLDIASRPEMELGMHIHPWNTPPLQEGMSVPVRDSYLANLHEPLIRDKLESTYDLFRQSGLRPRSFRGGRYSSGPVTQAFLRDHGFLVDSSILPFTCALEEDGAPDYRFRDSTPTRHPPRSAGDSSFWELPLTLIYTRSHEQFWNAAYQHIRSSWLARLRLIGLADRLGLVRRVWLTLEGPDSESVATSLEQMIATKRKLPYLCFSFHSSSLLVGGSPYAPTTESVEQLYSRMDLVFRTLLESEAFRPATLTQIAEELEESSCAS